MRSCGREKSWLGEKRGVVCLYQDVEETPVYSKLAVIELFKEEVMDQRKKPGCCKSVGWGWFI